MIKTEKTILEGNGDSRINMALLKRQQLVDYMNYLLAHDITQEEMADLKGRYNDITKFMTREEVARYIELLDGAKN